MRRLVTTLVLTMVAGGMTIAHHGLAAFDQTVKVTVSGTVTAFRFVNPHAVVEFDVRALYFLNSSCLKAFISFICGLAGQGLKCKVQFVTDARLGWQRRSLTALERMSPELVSIADT